MLIFSVNYSGQAIEVFLKLLFRDIPILDDGAFKSRLSIKGRIFLFEISEIPIT